MRFKNAEKYEFLEQDKSEILFDTFVQSRSQFKTNGIPVFFEQVLLLDLLFFMNSRSVYDRKINS